MAKRGFLIEDIAKPYNVKVNIPPFVECKQQFEPESVVLGRRIANTGIHVERAIGQIKVTVYIQIGNVLKISILGLKYSKHPRIRT